MRALWEISATLPTGQHLYELMAARDAVMALSQCESRLHSAQKIEIRRLCPVENVKGLPEAYYADSNAAEPSD